MRLASENSSVKPLVAERLKTDRQKPPLKPKSLSISKIRAGMSSSFQHVPQLVKSIHHIPKILCIEYSALLIYQVIFGLP